MSRYYLTFEQACKLKPGQKVQCHAFSEYMKYQFKIEIGTVCEVAGRAYRNYTKQETSLFMAIKTPSGREFILTEHECGMFHKYGEPETLKEL